jgi:hypothetical protein
MVVCIKKSLRDVSQPKDAFIQAWDTPKDVDFLNFSVPPPPKLQPPPPLSPSPPHTTPKYTREPRFQRLPRLKDGDAADVLVEKWTK